MQKAVVSVLHARVAAALATPATTSSLSSAKTPSTQSTTTTVLVPFASVRIPRVIESAAAAQSSKCFY